MQQQTRKNVICSVLALLLALTALTALSYNVMYTTTNTVITRAENGFSLMSFNSDVDYGQETLLIVIGVFCILQLLFSFLSLLFSILTIVLPNKAYIFRRNLFVYINELFLFFYALFGIIAATTSSYDMTTAAYIPLLYGTVLLLAYIYCSKKLPEPQNEEPAAYKTN